MPRPRTNETMPPAKVARRLALSKDLLRQGIPLRMIADLLAEKGLIDVGERYWKEREIARLNNLRRWERVAGRLAAATTKPVQPPRPAMPPPPSPAGAAWPRIEG